MSPKRALRAKQVSRTILQPGSGLAIPVILALALFLTGETFLNAQAPVTKPKDQAPLIVDGVVREVFRSDRQGRTDYLVQIEIQRAELRRVATVDKPARLAIPALGDSVYVHVSGSLDPSSRPPRDGEFAIPRERSIVRAYLTTRDQGGWQGVSADWFDLTETRQAEATGSDPAPSIPERVPGSTLGLKFEELKVQDRLALRVVRIDRDSPAQQAGLEEGDVIIGANNAALTSANQLEELNQLGVPFTVVVVDINSNRTVPVQITPISGNAGGSVASNRTTKTATAPATEPAGTRPAPSSPAPRIALGISAEPTRVGFRTALKVLSVEPNSPAAKAGVEPGDLLVKANGAALTSPEQLVSALRKSGSLLKLTVRDTRTGRDTEVNVNLAADGVPTPNPVDASVAVNSPNSNTNTGGGGEGGRLGAVTELAFYDADCAVRITEIVPGGAADRAGLRPGILILEANGKPMLHPKHLDEAVRTGGRSLKLVVVDPGSGRKSNVEVSL